MLLLTFSSLILTPSESFGCPGKLGFKVKMKMNKKKKVWQQCDQLSKAGTLLVVEEMS